jgi:hypothetical protein
MKHASIAPSLDADIHLVLCRFGRAGLAYVETDPAEADATTVIQNLLYGRYGEPLRVVALNVSESGRAMFQKRWHTGRVAHGARNATNVAALVSTPDDRSQFCAA